MELMKTLSPAPGNVLLQAGKPVISDFGIAPAVGVAGRSRLTETGPQGVGICGSTHGLIARRLFGGHVVRCAEALPPDVTPPYGLTLTST